MLGMVTALPEPLYPVMVIVPLLVVKVNWACTAAGSADSSSGSTLKRVFIPHSDSSEKASPARSPCVRFYSLCGGWQAEYRGLIPLRRSNSWCNELKCSFVWPITYWKTHRLLAGRTAYVKDRLDTRVGTNGAMITGLYLGSGTLTVLCQDQTHGVSTEPRPGFDSIGLAGIRRKSRFPMNRRRPHPAACPRRHPQRQTRSTAPGSLSRQSTANRNSKKYRPSYIEARFVVSVTAGGRREFWGNQIAGGAMGMRDGAVVHTRSISAGVRPEAWLTRSLRVRSSFKVSAAWARAGSILRVYSSRNPSLIPLRRQSEQTGSTISQ